MKRPLAVALSIGLGLPSIHSARAEYPAELDKGVKIDLGSPDRFLRIMTWQQLWLRYAEYNPGSLVRGQVREDGFDIGIRRSRLLLHGQMTKDLLLVLHAGINNQNTVGGGFGLGTDGPKKPQIFIHEAYGEYTVVGDHLALGGGLHYWNGVSRMASASTVSFLTTDAPIFNWPTIDKTDQFGMQLGVYAKGHFGNLEYRVALNKPFAVPEGKPDVGKTDYDPTSDTWAGQGYIKFDFLDRESNVLPYYAGTYLGKKRVWNIGAGAYYHPGSMAHLTLAGEQRRDDTLVLGVDSFVDLPTGGGSAFTGYVNVVYQDFGPDYVRNIGIMNPSLGTDEVAKKSLNGAGNALPTVGTGTTYYAQAGFLLPDVLGKAGQLQPFAAMRLSNYEGLDGPVVVPEAGVNWFVAGHHAKITLQYRSRPVFDVKDAKKVETDRKSELTTQLGFMF